MKYQIEITDNQLNLIILGVEMYARSLMGQGDIVADTLAENVFEYNKENPNNERNFDRWLLKRDIFKSVIQNAFDIMFGKFPKKNDTTENLIDIWHVLRHQQWLNLEDHDERDWDVRSYKPFQVGTEPLMKMERIDDDENENNA